MSDTPRVDAYVGNGVRIFDYREFTEFARQLERELSANRVLLEKTLSHRDLLSAQLSRMHGALEDSYVISLEGRSETEIIEKLNQFV